MRRDYDLIRSVLDLVNDSNTTTRPIVQVYDIEGYTKEEISYHLLLLQEAGFLKALELNSADTPILPIRLTWSGHEFIDDAKNETVWKRAMSVVSEKGGTISFALLQTLLIELGKRHFGL